MKTLLEDKDQFEEVKSYFLISCGKEVNICLKNIELIMTKTNL